MCSSEDMKGEKISHSERDLQHSREERLRILTVDLLQTDGHSVGRSKRLLLCRWPVSVKSVQHH